MPLRLALAMVAGFAALLALVLSVLATARYPDHALVVAAYPVVGLAFVAVGCIAFARRPGNGSGVLLSTTGALVLLASLGNVDDAALARIGVLAGQLPIAGFLHLVVAFPAGRLRGGIDRVLVCFGYVLLAFLQLPDAFDALDPLRIPKTVADELGVAVIAVAAVHVGRRVVAIERRGERRVLVAVYGYGIAMLLFFPFSARLLAPWLDLDAFALFALQMAVFVLAPFVFAAGVLAGGFGRSGELDELIDRLGSELTARGSMRDALAQVLGDPTLRVQFPAPAGVGHIDAAGQPAGVVENGRTSWVPVTGTDGAEIALLGYDRSLPVDPALVGRAGRVLALALERERLAAELIAEREALRASRARLVEVGDQQRRQLAQDLHDVVQSRLTLAALHAGSLAARSSDPATSSDAERLRVDLDELIRQFRRMVHGVMPALLLERGLAAAVEELVDRQPVATRLHIGDVDTLPPAVATAAYFVLAEALSNAVQHSDADRLDVAVDRHDATLCLAVRDDGVGGATPTGAGLRGIRDRVESLDGRVRIESPPGGGTSLEVELPCGS